MSQGGLFPAIPVVSLVKIMKNWQIRLGPMYSLLVCVDKKASSYIAQYPVIRTVQSALHFTSQTDLFTQTPYRLLWEASSTFYS